MHKITNNIINDDIKLVRLLLGKYICDHVLQNTNPTYTEDIDHF